MLIQPDALSALHAAFTQPFVPDPDPLTVSLTGRCPRCRRDLQEVAAVDQQLNRTRCSCGADLPKDWRVRLRSFLAQWEWMEKIPKFKRWVG